jgi:hypothetical protein
MIDWRGLEIHVADDERTGQLKTPEGATATRVESAWEAAQPAFMSARARL